MGLSYKEIMADETHCSDRVSFKDMFLKYFSVPTTTVKKFPKNSQRVAVYQVTPLLDREGDLTAYVYQLSCPICGNFVNRSHIYCSKCGNRLIEEKTNETCRS